jgi:hypothetical protein
LNAGWLRPARAQAVTNGSSSAASKVIMFGA